MIRYKAVSDTYKSCIIPYQSPYSLSYKIGETVKANKNTLGIMCFKTLKDAQKFWNGKILRVKTIGRGKNPKAISMPTTENLRNFYGKRSHSEWFGIIPPPKGTLCYPAVKVLSEVKERK